MQLELLSFAACTLVPHSSVQRSFTMASPQDLAGLLGATLNPDANTRISAELKLKEVLAIPGSSTITRSILTKKPTTLIESGLSLSRLILAQNVELPLRQMSTRKL